MSANTPAVLAPANRAPGPLGQRQITWIWGLLFINGLAYTSQATLFPIPALVGKLITQAALGLAVILALLLNRRRLIRPNITLCLFTILAATSLVMSIRGATGLGSLFRASRFLGFVGVLWLLTPWWDRCELAPLRSQIKCLMAVSGTVLLGIVLAPSLAFAPSGRLHGVIWPIPPTQAAHYAAVAAGLGAVLWLTRRASAGFALMLLTGGLAIVLLSQTRTALLALVAGVAAAGLSLFLGRRRVRRSVTALLIVAPLLFVAFAPAVSTWFAHGQSSTELTGLTGRTQVWDRLIAAPRPELNRWLGSGLSNKSFEGLPIDNSWLAIYQDQGLVGDAIVGVLLLFLLLFAILQPNGPARALAIFLVVYCTVASLTETGLGDVSPYLLDLTVAAALLAPSTRNLTTGRAGR